MRKLKFLLVFISCLLLTYSCSSLACAEESIEDELENEIENQLGELDLSDFEKFVKELNEDVFSVGFTETIQKLINGEEVFSLTTVFALIGEKTIKELVFGLPICVSIILLCVLSSTLSRFSSKLSGGSTENIIRFVSYSAVLVLLISSLYTLADTVKNLVGTISNFMNVIFPVMVTLLTVIGGGGSAGLFSPYLAILSSVVVNGLNAIIIPVFFACVTLSVVGNLTDSVKLDGIRKFLKSSCDWLLGLGFGVFCTFLGGQSIITGGVDGVTIKATKFALSSYVPILGGYLSDGFDIVLAGSVLIKNAIGITGIFLIFSIILGPVLKMIIFSLMLKLTSGIVQTLGEQKITDLLTSVSSTVSMLITFVLGVAFVFFFVIIMLVYTVNAGVV